MTITINVRPTAASHHPTSIAWAMMRRRTVEQDSTKGVC